MRTPVRSLVYGVLVVAGALAHAQGVASPFAGTWKLIVAKSHFHPGPPPQDIVRTYKMTGDSIDMTINGTRGDGSTIAARARFKLDGSDAHYTGTASMDTVAVTAVDARTWNATAKKQGKFLNQSIFSLSVDGNTLTQTLKGKSSRGDSVDDVLVYERL